MEWCETKGCHKMNPLVKECAAYFKSRNGLKLMLPLMKEKIYSYGEAKGKITMSELTDNEREDIALFLGINAAFSLPFSISLLKIQKALDLSKFEGVTIIELLEEVYHIKLKSRKEVNAEEDNLRTAYFMEVIESFPNTNAGNWMSEVVQTKSGCWPILARAYEQDKNDLLTLLKHVLTALNQLPLTECTRLDVFAAAITGDPHTFDDKRKEQALLLAGIQHLKQSPYRTSLNAEEKSEVLLWGGLVRDDLFNFTFCLRFKAMNNGLDHEGWLGFYDNYEVLSITLNNLKSIDTIFSEKKVFIIENPSVFSALSNCIHEQKLDSISLLCTTGQINSSSYQFLNLMEKRDCILYYCGDFDPEGLLIAQKLIDRFPQIQLWMYNEDAFKKSISKNVVSDTRLAMLDNLNDQQLKTIAGCIRESKRCGYQEKLIDDYINDLL